MNAPTGSGALPLQEYRRDIPPGWSPGDSSYSLRSYMEKLRIWYRIYNGDDESVGPLVAGRLYGQASRIAMNLRVPRPHGGYDSGDAALVRLAVDEVTDPTTGAVIQQHIPSGVQTLMNQLRATFGQQDQDLATQSLEKAFSLTRGKMSLPEYAAEFDNRMDEAADRAGLQVNDVGRFYLFFKNSGLSNRDIDSIKLQVNGDYTRYQDARALALRLSNNRSSQDEMFHGWTGYEDEGDWWDSYDDWTGYGEEGFGDDWWYYDDYMFDEYGNYYGDYDMDDSWQWSEGYEQYVDEQEDTQSSRPEPAEEQPPADSTVEDYYKGGKGRGKGKKDEGCFICGSKWHWSNECPMKSTPLDRGKGFGKGGGKSKGKGKGFGRKGFGKRGKGKGKYPSKGYGKKGYGKKGSWSWYNASPQEKKGLDISDGIPDGSSTMRQHLTSTGFGAQHQSIPTSSSEEELLLANKHHQDVEAHSTTTTPVDKKLSFVAMFPSRAAGPCEPEDVFFTVRGERRRGLIVDPGAASGLVGTETLRDMIQSCIAPHGKQDDIKYSYDKSTPVSGISGEADQTLGEVVLPLTTGGQAIQFKGEMIGGPGSLCPALVSNPALRKLKHKIFSDFFENGDGLLATGPYNFDNVNEMKFFRLLLTDSGHYILPTDEAARNNQVAEETQRRVTLFCHQVEEHCLRKWNDVKRIFITKEPSKLEGQSEGNRSGSVQGTDFLVDDKKKKRVTIKIKPEIVDYDLDKKNVKDYIGENMKEMIEDEKPERSILDDETLAVNGAEMASHDTKKHNDPLTMEPAVNRDMMDYYEDVEHFDKYTEDKFPDNLDYEYYQKLKKRYRAIPEEFYQKSGLRPVRPNNFHKWFAKMRGRGLRWHVWEWFSGSGRLSLLLMTAGLIVGFPVDLRYGWDVNNPTHADMLRMAQREFQPGVLHMSPDCGPWSVSGNTRPPELRQEDRRRDRNALLLVQEAAEEQDHYGRGYNVEQPLGSAMWKEDDECPLRLSHIYGHRKRQRCDQCMCGARDEQGSPIQKATGFGSNVKWKKTAIRCSGHKGRPHAHLQGVAPDGLARTAKAAVYPREMCQKMKQDILKFLHENNLLKVKTWPKSFHVMEQFYDCPRCQLGRSAPSDLEHTLIPGQCRHGRWAAGTGPRSQQNNAPQDPVQRWKAKARLENTDAIKIDYKLEQLLSEEDLHCLKRLLVEMVSDTLKTHKRKKSVDHWNESVFYMSLFKDIFKKTMQVKGIHVSLHPFKKVKPEPQLTTTSAYLRLPIIGVVKSWTVGPLEDLRELSVAQVNEALDVEDWMITVFGVDVAATPSPSTPGRHHRKRPPEPALPPRQDDTFDLPDVIDLPEDKRPPELVGGIYEDDPPEVPGDDEEFEASDAAKKVQPIRPNYNLRRVLQKLPQLVAAGDITKAKRLLLGLHERLWHSPINDYLNLLRRCGMDSDVLEVAREAVQECSICRKFTRLPHRPQTRVGGAIAFGDAIQIDIFHLQDTLYLLMIDEATRYKMCQVLPGQDSEQIMEVLLKSWIYLFGPPTKIIMDQQVSLMSHESAVEFERLNITRVPKGTTSGHAAAQHTGTGLVERHVDLIKITMLKLQAEMTRQGITLEDSEISGEAAMAHNLTLNYGGVTPAMCVFGALPRGFYESDGRGIMSTTGALQTDLSTFERALRIRQAALAQCHQAIIEDRVARTARSRPRQLEAHDLVAGTSEVEFHREVQGESGGWRGPALLLRLDAEEGTAVIQYQGRPYLVSIRHIRPYRGIFMVTTQEATVEHSLLRLLKYVEQLSQYKVHYVGWLLRKNGKWTHVPKNASSVMEIVSKAEKVSKSMTKRELHGILMGSSLRSFKPPHGTKGILVTWIRGGTEYAVQQHHSDHHVKMKKISNYQREEVCVLYFYYYEMANVETEGTDKKEDDAKMTTTPKSSSVSDATMAEQEPEASLKRQGPDSRTVVLAPEKKKQKIHYVENNQIEDYLREFHYYMNRRRKIGLEFPDTWKKDSQLQQSMRALRTHYYNEKKKNLPMLFNIDYKYDCGALACLRTARIYKVDSDTSNIDEESIDPKLWKEIDSADEAEIKQFAEEKAFKKIHKMQISEGMIEIDGVWIRKKKRYPGGELKMKSRMCARGCFDSQKHQLTTRSTTATKLSQRLAVSTAARKNLKLESLDIGGAFLKGYSFEAIRRALQKRGIQAPERKVVVYPPANVWRHLAKFDPQFDIGEDNISNYGLLCLKPIYGLNDAPLAWQLVLHEYVLSEGATASKMDENFFMWRQDGVPDSIHGVLTCHVDDLAIAGEAKWLDGLYERMVKKFKKVTRQTMPFEHCGAEYSETNQGLCISQKAFTERLQPTVVPNRPDEDKLKPEEVTMFRSQLGALLWLTSTRLDLIAEVSFLQSKVTTAQIKDLKQTNNVIQKAKDYKELGIHYRRFETKNQRLVCIHDASSASKGRNYAQEGVLVAVADDYFVDNIAAETSDEDQVKLHGGAMHVIHAHGCKAKRVSYSTSHAETLSMVGGLETATLCMLRLAEMMHPKKEPSLKDLIEIQESGHPNLPMDFYGDCRDLFELVTGERTLPQDKTQRLYVLAVKEARLSGRLRYVNLVPTQSMTADCLTKAMVSDCMMLLLTTGIVMFKNEKDHAVLSRTLPVFEEIAEDDLLLKDEEVKHKVQAGEKKTTCRTMSTTSDLRLKTLLTFVSFVTADSDAMEEKPVNGSYMSVYVAVFITVMLALMVEKYVNMFVAKTYGMMATWWT